jgi:Tfp pilus assembly protein PilX
MSIQTIFRLCTPVHNQRGTALILALVLLVVMSLLGALALTTTDSELAITTNVRAANEAFLAADRAVEYGMCNGAIISGVGVGTLDLDAFAADLQAGKGRLDTPKVNQIEFLSAGDLPVGVESDPTYFEGRYYRITANGAVEGHSAVSRIDTQFVRIFPKSGM